MSGQPGDPPGPVTPTPGEPGEIAHGEPTPSPAATTGGLLRSSAVVSVGTAVSRVTGLVRTMAIAFALTAGLADAYNLANTAPNVVYDLILGGVLAATLVPVLVSVTERGDNQGVRSVVTVITVALVALTAVAFLAAPGIVRLYTFSLDPAERAAQESVAVPLLRLFMPQVLFYGLTALFSALLNARRRFAAAAFAPALNNIVVIVVLLAVRRMASGDPTVDGVLNDTGLLWLLGAGTTLGIVAMALVLVPAVRAAGLPLAPTRHWRHPAVRRIAMLSGWTLAYVVVNQVGFVVLLALANSSAGAGSLSAYSYAYLFFQLPYGLFAVAVMTAFLPELSQAADAGDNRWFTERFGTGLRLVALVLLPCAVLYVALSSQLVEVLFSRGSFSAASAGLTSEALMVFGASLPGFAVLMYTMRGFYARKDTRTPFLIATGKVAVMVAVAWPLSRLGLGGVVAAFGVAFTLAAVVGLVILGRRTGGIMGAATTSSLARTGLATAVMLAVALVVPRGVAGTGALGALVDLVVVGAVAGGVYLAALAILRSPDLGWAAAQVRSRRRTTSPGPDR